MQALTWNVGEVKITQIAEIEAGGLIQKSIPQATPDNIVAIPWMFPHFADATGQLKALVQVFVLETSSARILVDTGIGNGKRRTEFPECNMLHTDFLARFMKLGFKLREIDFVLSTHLHFDHVGWNIMEMGPRSAPTFPSAKYLFNDVEYKYWQDEPRKESADDRAGFADSVQPILDMGLAEIVPIDHSITREVSLMSTPGHSPGHVSVLIQSAGQQALITGDAILHPCQIARPSWETTADSDKGVARMSRTSLLERFSDGKTLILGSHFPAPVAGYLRRERDGFRLFV